jgi:hypothetical protein
MPDGFSDLGSMADGMSDAGSGIESTTAAGAMGHDEELAVDMRCVLPGCIVTVQTHCLMAALPAAEVPTFSASQALQ